MKPLTEEVVRRFMYADEQMAVVEKVVAGRLSPDYLLWNGLTK